MHPSKLSNDSTGSEAVDLLGLPRAWMGSAIKSSNLQGANDDLFSLRQQSVVHPIKRFPREEERACYRHLPRALISNVTYQYVAQQGA